MAEDVRLFALSTCIHCKKAREFLDKEGVKYECTYVDKLTDEEREKCIEELKKYNPSLSFPTLVSGESVVVGFDEKALRKILKL